MNRESAEHRSGVGPAPADEAGELHDQSAHVRDSLLAELVDGILPLEEAGRVSRHLESCEQCRDRLEATTGSPAPGDEVGECVTHTFKSRPSKHTLLEPGARVDHFTIVGLLGHGGMGEVYLAEDSTLARKVALKLIAPAFLGRFGGRARFLQEARTTATFNHPNIVSIYAVGEHRGRPYMALEYLEGKSLRQHLSGATPSSLDAVRIGLPIAQALTEAHSHGVLHRDLKPANIMMPRYGGIRVLDFGLAKRSITAAKDGTKTGADAASGEDTPSGPSKDAPMVPGTHLAPPHLTSTRSLFLGTPAYMAPEQWRREKSTAASDVWALGMILYKLCSGKRPYQGIASRRLADRVAGSEPVPGIAEVADGIPAGLADLIDRCLAKDPAERPTAEETAHRLKKLYARITESRPMPVASPGWPVPEEGTEPDWTEGGRREGARKGAGHTEGGHIGWTGVDPADDVPAPRFVLEDASHPAALRRRWAVVAVVSILVVLAAIYYVYQASEVPLAATAPALEMGLYPASLASDPTRELRPLTDYLNSQLNRPIEVEVASDYRTLRHSLLTGVYQLAILPPLQYVLARAEYPELVGVASMRYEGAMQGYLVIRSGEVGKALEALAGATMCYVDPGSVTGYLLPRRYIRAAGLDPDTLFSKTHFSGSHQKALQDVASGRCDVAAVYSEAYVRAHTAGIKTAGLHLLAVTGSSPPDMLCASPSLPAEQVLQVQEALLRFQASDTLGRSVVSEAYPYTITGFAAPSLESFEEILAAAREEGLL